MKINIICTSIQPMRANKIQGFSKTITKRFFHLEYLFVAVGTVLYSILSLWRHFTFNSSSYDLGIFDQAIWQLSRFHFGPATVRGLPNLFADHFHPLLILISPLYWVWDNVVILLIFQAAVVSLGALPLFWIAKYYLKSRPAAYIIAFSYLLFFGVQNAIYFDFRPETLVAAFFLFAFWFALDKRYLLYSLSIFLLLISKENVAFYVLFLGLYFLIFQRKYLLGAATAAAGLAWGFVTLYFIIPYFNKGAYIYFSTYSGLGNSTSEILKTIITNPVHTLQVLVTPARKIKTILYIFGSGGFLAFLSPSAMFMAIPFIGERFLSSIQNRWLNYYHYDIHLAPLVYIGAVIGIKNILSFVSPKILKFKPIFLLYGLVLLVFLGSFATNLRFNQLHKIFSPAYYKGGERQISDQKAMDLIPARAKVAATNTLVPHLSHRDDIWDIVSSKGAEKADYVLIDGKDPWFGYRDEVAKNKCPQFKSCQIEDLLAGLDQSSAYGLVFSENNAALFKKGASDTASLSRELTEIAKKGKASK